MILGEIRTDEELILDVMRRSDLVFAKCQFGYYILADEKSAEWAKEQDFFFIKEGDWGETWQKYSLHLFLVRDFDEFKMVSKMMKAEHTGLNEYKKFCDMFWDESYQKSLMERGYFGGILE